MIPLKLSLRNFLCYRDNVPPLSFEGMHTACLCGDNGHGKSALLDALTWALWGEARSKSDDDLIHLGQTEMEVELEFLAGGSRYRARRQRTRGKPGRAGQSLLALHSLTPQGARDLSGNTIRETQEGICRLLGMDYETFVHSAFLRQGEAGLFTTKKPAQRKEILAEILGLGRYELLAEKARETARAREETVREREQEIRLISEELSGKPLYDEERQRIMGEMTDLQARLEELGRELEGLEKERQALSLKEEQRRECLRRMQEASRELASWQQEAERRSGKIGEYQSLLACKSEIEEGYDQLLTLRKTSEELNRKLSQLQALTEQRGNLPQRVEQARGELAAEAKVQESEMRRLESKLALLPALEWDLAEARQRLTAVEAEEKALEARRNESQELLTQAHVLQAANVQLRQEMEELREKVDLLAGAGAQCPLCEADLDPQGKERIRAKYEAEGLARKQAYLENKKTAEQKEREGERMRLEVQRREKELGEARRGLQVRLSRLEVELAEAVKARDGIEACRVALSGLQARLASRDYAPEEQKALAQVEAAMAALAYHPQEHREVQQRLSEREGYEAQKRRLEEAETVLAQDEELLRRAQAQLSRWEKALEEERRREEELSQALAFWPRVEKEIQTAEEQRWALQARVSQRQQELGAVNQKLDRCALLKEKKRQLEAEGYQAAREKALYEELAQAFGKGGVQALIIETALPEIEEEANRLLARMTEGRMSLRLETQRERKTRGKGEEAPIETLDIRISDEQGTRDYELYSGGEAFRIDFALRIALSKLLARRAGAPLPTLIIDEGFGTQDSAGRDRVVEALRSIEEDFERILVVTHIEELKEAFPVRIEVTKTPTGSTFTVV